MVSAVVKTERPAVVIWPRPTTIILPKSDVYAKLHGDLHQYLRVEASRVGEEFQLSVESNCHGRRSSVSTGAKHPQPKLAYNAQYTSKEFTMNPHKDETY